MSNVLCGTVSAQGQITSNGNFICRVSNGNTYAIEYNGAATNPVPVVSLVNQNPMLTYVLNAYAGGFTLYTYQNVNGTPTPYPTDFNFIVGQIV